MFFNCHNKTESKKLYRKLSMYLHPDKGGDDYLMSLLTSAYHACLERGGAATEDNETKRDDINAKEYESNEIYPMSYDDIRKGDSRLDIISEIHEYASNHKKFNIGYIESIKEYLSDNAYISSTQYNTLRKIYYSFHMGEWLRKNNA